MCHTVLAVYPQDRISILLALMIRGGAQLNGSSMASATWQVSWFCALMRPYCTGLYRHEGWCIASLRANKTPRKIGTPITDKKVDYQSYTNRIHREDAPQRVNMVHDCVLDAPTICGRIIPGTCLGTLACYDRNAVNLSTPNCWHSEDIIVVQVVREKNLIYPLGVFIFIYWVVSPILPQYLVSFLNHGFWASQKGRKEDRFLSRGSTFRSLL